MSYSFGEILVNCKIWAFLPPAYGQKINSVKIRKGLIYVYQFSRIILHSEAVLGIPVVLQKFLLDSLADDTKLIPSLKTKHFWDTEI